MNNSNLVPLTCPSCNHQLIWSETGVDLLCTNIECPAQILYKIEYFLKTLGAEELSATTLEKFNLKSLEDLFKLSKDYIKSLDGFQERRADIIIKEIKKTLNNADTSKVLASFGIQGLGLKNAEKIIKLTKKSGYEAFEKFFEFADIELMSINGIGIKLVECINENKNHIRNTLNMLKEYGLTFKENENSSLLLENMNITMTGSAPKMTRSQLEQLVKDNGGNITGISKKSSLLIAEDINGNSSKLKKAKELGIKIITYDEFFEMLDL